MAPRRRSSQRPIRLAPSGPRHHGAVEDGWQVVTLAYADLAPFVIARSVDAPPFNPDAIDGEFALDIDWIDVCN